MKWLKELEEEKLQLMEKKEVEEKEKMERMRSFMKRDAEKQAVEKTDKDESESATRYPDIFREEQILALSSSNASSSALPTTSGKKKMKPAWCQSEKKQEASELDTETNLLSFVEGLDFDQYAQDLELQVLIGQIKQRIKTLEREKKKDQNLLQTCINVSSRVECVHNGIWWITNILCVVFFKSENAQRADAVNIGSEPIADVVSTVIEQKHDIDVDDTESIATNVMSESNVGSVHSKKSLKALVSKAKGRMLGITIEDDGDEEENNQEREIAVPPPVLSTVTDDNGARMAEKKSINKLAFKNRNPAL
ncbi:hypothetical protein ACHAXA_005650 [Cyclostephanos tholiformis]|uniref:Uncharacterized protein n=1 Tax=Cyclostephanos tholiformis TaxID=382380 RepID=A0ABD3RCG2_9STRA